MGIDSVSNMRATMQMHKAFSMSAPTVTKDSDGDDDSSTTGEVEAAEKVPGGSGALGTIIDTTA